MTSVIHEIDGKVGMVTLAKPPHNLMDDAMLDAIVAAYRTVVAAILLRSSQRQGWDRRRSATIFLLTAIFILTSP